MPAMTDHLRAVFSEANSYESFRKVASSLARGTELFEYDDNGNERRISKAEANKAVSKVFMNVLGLDEKTARSPRNFKRAMKKYGEELYAIIEQDVEFRVEQGFGESEWFNSLVDMKTRALGDDNDFIATDANSLFIVSDLSGDNHDVTMQQLPEGKHFSVPVSYHGIKTGKDIAMIILGKVNYSDWLDKIAPSFIRQIQEMIFDGLVGASDQLPSEFKMTGDLTSATKASFDDVLANVSTANGSDIIIVGTKVALKKLNALTTSDVMANSQKESIAATGVIGNYEGTMLLEVPQRFKIGTYENIISNDMLMILPVGIDPFVKYFDYGETEVIDITEKGDLQDNFQTHEIQRAYGCGVVLGCLFGKWTKA